MTTTSICKAFLSQGSFDHILDSLEDESRENLGTDFNGYSEYACKNFVEAKANREAELRIVINEFRAAYPDYTKLYDDYLNKLKDKS